jgi:hypothetical protein
MRLGSAHSRSPRDRGWVFHKGNCPTWPLLTHRLVASPPPNRAQGLSPPTPLLGDGSVTAPGCDPKVFAVPSFLSSTPCSDSWHRIGWNFTCASIHTSPLVALGRTLYSQLARPFVCGCHTIATLPVQLDDTRPPWVTHMSSPPCRPHTPCCDGEEPKRLRLHRAGSTIPRLGPTGSPSGWLPLMTTRWVSASPSDPPSREAPCPPKIAASWLQVPLGRFPLSRSCPCRVLHTCLALRPVRHDPHFWIATWGLRLRGTSTHLTYGLPGTHYVPLRLPSYPFRSTSLVARAPIPCVLCFVRGVPEGLMSWCKQP